MTRILVPLMVVIVDLCQSCEIFTFFSSFKKESREKEVERKLMIFSVRARSCAAESLTIAARLGLQASYREPMLMVQCEFYWSTPENSN